MKKNPVLVAVGCLLLGLFGCETDDGVQKGYLAPQPTAPSSSSETSSASASTSGDRLPAPSVTQNVSSPATPEVSGASSPAPGSSEVSAKTVSSSSSSGPAPSAIAKNDQRPGGKVGGPGSSIRRQTRVVGEQNKPKTKVSKMTSTEQDEDEATSRAKTETAPVAVSSNLSPGNTRIAEPTGNVMGVILTINNAAKFVVVKFQYRAVPSVGKVLSVKRNGEKVGQIKVTAPVKPPLASADILNGDIQRGDAVE